MDNEEARELRDIKKKYKEMIAEQEKKEAERKARAEREELLGTMRDLVASAFAKNGTPSKSTIPSTESPHDERRDAKEKEIRELKPRLKEEKRANELQAVRRMEEKLEEIAYRMTPVRSKMTEEAAIERREPMSTPAKTIERREPMSTPAREAVAKRKTINVESKEDTDDGPIEMGGPDKDPDSGLLDGEEKIVRDKMTDIESQLQKAYGNGRWRTVLKKMCKKAKVEYDEFESKDKTVRVLAMAMTGIRP